MNNKFEIYKFRIFEFWIFYFFKISDIGLLWSKITIFIIEITLKLICHTKFGWNNPNWGRLSLKSSKLHFFAISGISKFIAYSNIQIHVLGSIFNFNLIFFKCAEQCPLSESIIIGKPKKHPFMSQRSPFKSHFLNNLVFAHRIWMQFISFHQRTTK